MGMSLPSSSGGRAALPGGSTDESKGQTSSARRLHSGEDGIVRDAEIEEA
jgi:hypothetical protein